jgi:DNA polymerase-4
VSATMEVCFEAVSPACDPVDPTCLTKDGRTLTSRRAANGAGGDSYVVHVRMDGFFAAVEQVMRPKFGRPVLVADDVVVSASYEAKFFGIKVGMAVADALRFCPSTMVLSGRYDRYAKYAERVRAIAETFTPVVDADACHGFYLDFCGSQHICEDFPGTLRRLQLEILKHTGLSASVGAGRTRVVAAIASRIEQPRGIRIVRWGTEDAFLSTLPVEALGSIGMVEAAKLRERGISTMAELRRVPLASLEAAYGEALGRQIWKNSRGIDLRGAPRSTTVQSLPSPSLSREICVEGCAEDAGYLGLLTEYVCRRISSALTATNRRARTIGLRIRYIDQFSASQTVRLGLPSNKDRDLLPAALGLLKVLFTRHVAVQALEVSAGGLFSVSVSDLYVNSRSLTAAATA